MAYDKTVDTLNMLIETSKDGEYGFRKSAEYLKSSEMKQIFLRRAEECRRAVLELQELVMHHGGKAEDSGTAAGAMHRSWVAMKGSLTGFSDKAIFEEAERGEDVAMERYRQALQEPALTAEARVLVQRQFEGVNRNHAQMRALRDQARRATT